MRRRAASGGRNANCGSTATFVVASTASKHSPSLTPISRYLRPSIAAMTARMTSIRVMLAPARREESDEGSRDPDGDERQLELVLRRLRQRVDEQHERGDRADDQHRRAAARPPDRESDKGDRDPEDRPRPAEARGAALARKRGVRVSGRQLRVPVAEPVDELVVAPRFTTVAQSGDRIGNHTPFEVVGGAPDEAVAHRLDERRDGDRRRERLAVDRQLGRLLRDRDGALARLGRVAARGSPRTCRRRRGRTTTGLRGSPRRRRRRARRSRCPSRTPRRRARSSGSPRGSRGRGSTSDVDAATCVGRSGSTSRSTALASCLDASPFSASTAPPTRKNGTHALPPRATVKSS